MLKGQTARTTQMTIASQVDHEWKKRHETMSVKLDHKVNKINTLVSMRCATCGQHSSRSSGHLEERGVSVSPCGVGPLEPFLETLRYLITLPLAKKNTLLELKCPQMTASVTLSS